MSSIDEAKAREVLALTAEQAQPVAEALVVAISKMQPMPTPLVTACACRLVCLYAAKALLDAADAAQQDTIRDAFLMLDRLTSVDALRSGDIEFNEGVVADLANGTKVPGSRLPNLGHDPTVFDIDAWEEKKP